MKKLLMILTLSLVSTIGSQAWAWNPLTDIRDNLVWTFGQQAETGTAVKVWGSGDLNPGDTTASFLAGIFDYRFLRTSYGVIRINKTDGQLSDSFKVGYKVSSFLNWFKNPPTPTMEFLKNVNIGPAYSIPVLSSPHAGVLFVEFNYVFSGAPVKTP